MVYDLKSPGLQEDVRTPACIEVQEKVQMLLRMQAGNGQILKRSVPSSFQDRIYSEFPDIVLLYTGGDYPCSGRPEATSSGGEDPGSQVQEYTVDLLVLLRGIKAQREYSGGAFPSWPSLSEAEHILRVGSTLRWCATRTQRELRKTTGKPDKIGRYPTHMTFCMTT